MPARWEECPATARQTVPAPMKPRVVSLIVFTAVIGMFLGGAGLADVMLYCRERIYPLGLPNGVSHFITAVAVVLRQHVDMLPKTAGRYAMSFESNPTFARLRRDGSVFLSR